MAAQAAVQFTVALLAEGVDRNYANDNDTLTTWVALLAEGVDRNCCVVARVPGMPVALLAEGVDRNGRARPTRPLGLRRPPRGGRG